MTISRWVVLGSLLAAFIGWQPASVASIGMPAGSTVWMEFATTGGETGSNQAGLAPPNGIPQTTINSTLDPLGRGTGYAEILPTSIRTLVDGFRAGAFMHASFQDTYTVGGAATGPFDITVQLHVTGSMSGLTLFGQTSLQGVVDAKIGTFNPSSDPDFPEGSRVSPFNAGASATTGLQQLFVPGSSFAVNITASHTKTGVNVGDVFDIGYQVRSAAPRGQIDLLNTGGTISFVLPEGMYLTSALAGGALASGDSVNIIGNTTATSIDLSSLTSVVGSVNINGNTAATVIDVSSVTIVGGELAITDNTAVEVINVGALVTVAGELNISGNILTGELDLPSLVSTGELTITDNTSVEVINTAALVTVSGELNISGNTSVGELDLPSLVSTGELTITDNTSAEAINVGALTMVAGELNISGNTLVGELDLPSLVSTGELTITDNGPATVNVAANVTVGGELTIETTGSGTYDVSGAAVGGDTSLSTDGYTEVAAATAGGETAVTMLNSEATMEVTLPDGAFTSDNPVTFSIEKLPGGGVETVGGQTITHLETYAFDFAIPTLNSAAELNFEIDLVAMAEPDRLSLLGLLHESAELTLGVRGDAPGAELQLFDVCSGGGPVADACVVVQWLDENRMLLDPLAGIDPSLLRFESLVGHFSTYSVVAVTLAGDYNRDGTVDAADYVVWRKNDGTQEGYDNWRTNFGRTAGGGDGSAVSLASQSQVPEPSAASLLGLAIMSLGVHVARLRRQRN